MQTVIILLSHFPFHLHLFVSLLHCKIELFYLRTTAVFILDILILRNVIVYFKWVLPVAPSLYGISRPVRVHRNDIIEISS